MFEDLDAYLEYVETLSPKEADSECRYFINYVHGIQFPENIDMTAPEYPHWCNMFTLGKKQAIEQVSKYLLPKQ